MKTSRTPTQWLSDGAAVLGLVFLLLVPLLLLASVVQYWRISMNQATASGVVREKSAREDRGEGLMDSFVLRYSFTAASGGDHSGEANVGKGFYERVALGDRLVIEYAADDPGNNRVRGELSPPILMTFAAVALLVCLFGIVGVRRLARHVARPVRSGPSP